jgi:uncharacterized protein (DUF1330 family)
MKTRYAVVLSMIAGAALGGAAIQSLHAQAKPKTYVITEGELLDAAAAAAFTPHALAALTAAGGRSLRTFGGRIVAIEGAAAPNRVAINEWDSVEQAQAYHNSQAWKDLVPQFEKAIKIIRRYAVEATH